MFFTHLVCTDSRMFRQAGYLDTLLILAKIQKSTSRIQQITDHLVIYLTTAVDIISVCEHSDNKVTASTHTRNKGRVKVTATFPEIVSGLLLRSIV